MKDSVQENLLGLLLGVLEDDERRELEEQLETDAELRAEFAKLRECVEPLDRGRVNYEPAAGLADRTFAFVQREAALQEAGLRESEAEAAAPVQLTPVKEQAGRRSWSTADVIAATTIIAASLILMLPALFASWESSNRLSCQANLRQIGWALHDFAQQTPTQRLPQIPVDGNRSFAGIYAPVLYDRGYVDDSRVFLCASSNLARGEVKWELPPVSRIDRAGKSTLIRLQRLAGGSFGYNLGYWQGDKYVAPSVNNQDARYVWASDAPTWNIAGRISENHGGRGHNLLFADQHIQFAVGCYVQSTGDDAFRSDRGLVEAGVDRRDSVIGDSRARPLPESSPFPQ